MKVLNRFYLPVAVLLSALAYCITAFAQDGQPAEAPVINPLFALIGSGISLLVTFLRGIPFVRQNPKLCATILSVVSTAALAFFKVDQAAGLGTYLAYGVAQLVTAIGTYEVAVKPVVKANE